MTGILLPLYVLLFVLNLEILYVNATTYYSLGFRNLMFDDVYETRDEIIVLNAKTELVCFMACTNRPECWSISYNVENGACQHFSTVFSKTSVSGIMENGWIHYDKNYKDCGDVDGQRYYSGIYSICPDKGSCFDVYCFMDIESGGWTVLMRRYDRSTNFTRGWSEYEGGFGNTEREFWLGNKYINRLTASGNFQLKVYLRKDGGLMHNCIYSTFSVGDAASNYTLSVDGYTGNTGDCLYYHNGRPFTTTDKDNDYNPNGNCASDGGGGWWYSFCGKLFLTSEKYNDGQIGYNNGCGETPSFYIVSVTMMVRRG